MRLRRDTVLTKSNLKKLTKRSARGCWVWPYASDKKGYGMKRENGTLTYVHRISWRLFNGPVPHGKFVCHKCDNPPCCNPNHLFVGTRIDNQNDMRSKGRHANPPTHYGESHPLHKLTNASVRRIKSRLAAGGVMQHIANDYGVSLQAIYNIKRKRTWVSI